MKKITGLIITIILIIVFTFNHDKKNHEQLQNNLKVEPLAKEENSHRTTDVNTASRMDKMLKTIELSNLPVKLYGIVIDEDEKPVSGAMVSWRVQQGGYFNSPPAIRKNSITDSMGLFVVEGVRGTSLGFDEIAKDGYHQAYTAYSAYGCGSYIANSSKPEKFLMLKNEVLDATDLGYLAVPLNWNNGPTRIPIGLDGTDLVVIATRDPNPSPSGWMDWDVSISLIDACLQEVANTQSRLAPLDNYVESLHYGDKAAEKKSCFSQAKNFAFKTNSGLYGNIKMSLNIGSQGKENSIYLDIIANMFGKRNLNIQQ